MCGEPLTQVASSGSIADPDASEESISAAGDLSDPDDTDSVEESSGNEDQGAIVSVMVERQSRITLVLAFFSLIIIVLLAAVVLRFPTSANLSFIATETALPPTTTFTPSLTPLFEEQVATESTPTVTPEFTPSDTAQAPRAHSVSAGETMFGLGFRYGVSSESIALVNGLAPDAGLVVSQQLIIPWPTATPPLEPVAVEVSNE